MTQNWRVVGMMLVVIWGTSWLGVVASVESQSEQVVEVTIKDSTFVADQKPLRLGLRLSSTFATRTANVTILAPRCLRVFPRG